MPPLPPRRARLVSTFLLLLATAAQAAPKQPVPIATWWVDPDSGLMWSSQTGFVHHDAAVQACANLRLYGADDWRLPTQREVRGATRIFTQEDIEKSTYLDRAGLPTTTYSSRGLIHSLGLKFDGAYTPNFWTADAAGATHFIAFVGGTRGFKSLPARSIFLVSSAGTYCVRPADPSLQKLAAAAHATAPVPSVDYLQDLATLYSAEHVTTLADMPAAITQARSVAAHNQSLASRALNLAAFDEILEGQFDAAEADLDQAHTYRKFDLDVNSNIRWLKQLRGDVRTDPRTLPMWLALHKADIASSDGNPSEGEADANAAIAIAPDWADGYERLGNMLVAQGKREEAIAAFQKARHLKSHSGINIKSELNAAKKMHKDRVPADSGKATQ